MGGALCMVCCYRRDGFADGYLYPIQPAAMKGLSYSFEGVIGVCDEHVSWVDEDLCVLGFNPRYPVAFQPLLP